MSPDVLARVLALENKANELLDKGHLLRAAEYYGRATEAALPLGADNLVALNMQLQQSNLLIRYASASMPGADIEPRIRAAHGATSLTLISDALAALERRRVAGTLLEGKCSAVEEAWYASVLQRDNARLPASYAASWAPLVGYAQFLNGAVNAMNLLRNAGALAAECSVAQLEAFAQHVVQAAELMQQPRRHGDSGMGMNAMFTDGFRRAVNLADPNGLDARLVQLLAGAQQQLERSGVLQARRIETRIPKLLPMQEAFNAAMLKSLTAPDLRTCALPGCGAKEAHPAHFKSCAACRTVVYCCREHQVEGWPAHKKACKAARKAAAAADDAAGPSGA